MHSFVVDGDHQGINQLLLETRLPHNFSQQVDITVAVRSAKDYLGLAHSPSAQDTSQSMSEDTGVLLDAMWRLKQEFPDVVDPAIQELLDGKALIPVWYLDDGTFTIPAYLSSAIDETGHGVFGSTQWESDSYDTSDSATRLFRITLDNLARGLQFDATQTPDMRNGLNLALMLALDDSRLNAVAVLGRGSAASPAEAEQRIFELSRWHGEWERNWPRGLWPSERATPDYRDRVESFSALVAALGIRDDDIHRRAQELLNSARGRSPHK